MNFTSYYSIRLILILLKCSSYFLITFSPSGELQYLSRLGLISKYLVDDILNYRSQAVSSKSRKQPSTEVEVEVEAEAEDEMSEESARLHLEMSDFIGSLGGLFTELGSLPILSRTIPLPSSLDSPLPSPTFPVPSRTHSNTAMGMIGSAAEDVAGHDSLGVIARAVLSFMRHRLYQVSNQNNQRSGARGTGGGGGAALGGFLTANLKPSTQSTNNAPLGFLSSTGPGTEYDDVISACEYIESPLKVIKRAGLDMLSSGWGR